MRSDPLELERARNELHDWYRRQMDLCGGWHPQIDANYAPRLLGMFAFTPEESRQLVTVGRQLGSLYHRVGHRIRQDGRLRERLLKRLPAAEQAALSASHDSSLWASTLRADAVFDDKGRLKILEVNTDNVAGPEDILIQLEFWRKKGRPIDGERATQHLTRLRNGIRKCLDFHWAAFQAAPGFCGRRVRSPTICVSFQDREDSFFMARYLGAVLRDLGYEVTVQRPEHIHVGDDGLLEAEQIGERRTPVDLVLRHWLSLEMYSPSRTGEPELEKKFGVLFHAAQEGRALIMNPFNDRFLFSKEILALLSSSHQSEDAPIPLTHAEREFCSDHIVQTELVELAPTGTVLKAADSYGGKDVIVGNASGVPWVRQPFIDGRRTRGWYRTPATGVWGEQELHVVHGLLVQRLGEKEFELTGIFTRLGPSPVVNWIRGAQFIPGLLA